jgi:hypothetical protein
LLGSLFNRFGGVANRQEISNARRFFSLGHQISSDGVQVLELKLLGLPTRVECVNGLFCPQRGCSALGGAVNKSQGCAFFKAASHWQSTQGCANN